MRNEIITEKSELEKEYRKQFEFFANEKIKQLKAEN